MGGTFFKTLSFVVGLSLTTAFAASAGTILNPGGVIGPPGTITYGGTIVAGLSGTFSASTSTGQFTGSYTAIVYSDPNNLLCSGCYDFVINLNSNFGSTDNIERISDGTFNTSGVLVGTDAPLTGRTTPCATPTSTNCYKDVTSVSRTTDGSSISFSFSGDNNIAGGESSASLVIQTGGTVYAPGSLAIQDDVTADSLSFGNVGTPEPMTIALLGGGLAFLGLTRLRTSRKK
jgi:hypothetical protein